MSLCVNDVCHAAGLRGSGGTVPISSDDIHLTAVRFVQEMTLINALGLHAHCLSMERIIESITQCEQAEWVKNIYIK